MIKLAAGIAFLILIAIYVWKDRKNIERSSIFFVRRTEKAIHLLDKLAKIPGLKLIYTLGIPLCMLGILYILLMVGSNAFFILKYPSASPGLAPVIPGVKIPGSPIFVPLGYGILGLFILLIVHETSHGITARIDKIKVKSTGLLLALVLPGAFVEPDKKAFDKAKPISKLRVAAAGSFANIMTAILAIALIVLILAPYSPTGLVVTHTYNDTPGYYAFNQTTVITHFDGKRMGTIEDLGRAINATVPNQTVSVNTLQLEDEKVVQKDILLTTISKPNQTEQSYVGINAGEPSTAGLFLTLPISSLALVEFVHPLYWSLPAESFIWYILNALKWIAFLNFAIGAVNLLPVMPLDGGIMIKEIAKKISPKIERPIVLFFSILVIAMFAVNLLPYFF
ncbi:site-2 protease family protein [Candidatus Undinarchaeota archaeon]